MNVRLWHRRWLWTVVALAPLLFIRALIPNGFMADFAGGEVRISFCGGGLDGAAHGNTAASDPCPFALSAGAAPLPSFDAALTIAVLADAPPSTAGATGARLDTCPRAQQSRAPPFVLSLAA